MGHLGKKFKKEKWSFEKVCILYDVRQDLRKLRKLSVGKKLEMIKN